MLSENGVRIVKFLLYISRDEQAKRFRERIDDPSKNWKFSPADIKEREYWDQYIEAYQDMLEKCSTEWAPVVRDSGQPQVVPQPGGFRDRAADAGEHGFEVPQAHRGPGGSQVRVGGMVCRLGLAS